MPMNAISPALPEHEPRRSLVPRRWGYGTAVVTTVRSVRSEGNERSQSKEGASTRLHDAARALPGRAEIGARLQSSLHHAPPLALQPVYAAALAVFLEKREQNSSPLRAYACAGMRVPASSVWPG